MEKPLLYDLFCGGGGSTKGFQRAGFHVIGVDNKDQPRYCGDGFVCMDAFEFMRLYLAGKYERAAAFAASPPCQAYSRMRHLPWLRDRKYPALIPATRDVLNVTGVPWVIENVEDAPLLNGITLCGTMFGLPLYRHRKFESNVLLMGMEHKRHEHVIFAGGKLNKYSQAGGIVGVYGHIGGVRMADAKAAMGIDWMIKDELTQAIPPIFTEYVGGWLMKAIGGVPGC